MAGVRKRKADVANTADTQRPAKSKTLKTKKKWTGRMLNSTRRSSAITEANKKTRLLSLPPEIRNRIYELVIGVGTIHAYHYDFHTDPRKCKYGTFICEAETSDSDAALATRHNTERTAVLRYRHRHHACFCYSDAKEKVQGRLSYAQTRLSLLETCKKIHSEAALLPFRLNNISFDCNEDLLRFAQRLIVPQRRAILSITLNVDGQRSISKMTRWYKHLVGFEELILFYDEYGRGIENDSILRASYIARARSQLSQVTDVFGRTQLKRAVLCMSGIEKSHLPYPNEFSAFCEDFSAFCEDVETKLLKSAPAEEQGEDSQETV